MAGRQRFPVKEELRERWQSMKAAHEMMQSCLLGMAGSRDQNAIFIRIAVSLFVLVG